MNGLVEKRENIQRFYTKYSSYIDKIVRFVAAFCVFMFIHANIGFLKVTANPFVAIVLSVICAFLSMNITVVMVCIYTLVQLYALAPGIAVVVAVVFLVMFIFCFRFEPKKSILLLLMPIAFMLKIPMLVPIACGLLYTPTCLLAMGFGVIFYYIISYVESYTAILENATELGIMGQLTTYAGQLLGNKEMWFMLLSFAVCLLVVYNIRKTSGDNAWKIAVITGSIVNMIVLLFISIDINVNLSPILVIIGTVISALLAFLIEFFAFPVDYSRTEYLQFEDDEYYYYVKAVPKLTVAAPKKTVKKINERQETRSLKPEVVKETTGSFSFDESFPDEFDLQKILEEELNK